MTIGRHDCFAQRLRIALAASDTTASALARACGVSPQAVSRWTTGSGMPSSQHLVAITRITGASIDWLMLPEKVSLADLGVDARTRIHVGKALWHLEQSLENEK